MHEINGEGWKRDSSAVVPQSSTRTPSKLVSLQDEDAHLPRRRHGLSKTLESCDKTCASTAISLFPGRARGVDPKPPNSTVSKTRGAKSQLTVESRDQLVGSASADDAPERAGFADPKVKGAIGSSASRLPRQYLCSNRSFSQTASPSLLLSLHNHTDFLGQVLLALHSFKQLRLDQHQTGSVLTVR